MSYNPTNSTKEDLKNTLDSYKLTKSLQKNIELFKNIIFKDDETVIYRELKNKYSNLDFCLIYVNGMTDNDNMNDFILKPLINSEIKTKHNEQDILNYIKSSIININEIILSNDFNIIIPSILYGDTILIADGYENVLILNSKGWPSRKPVEPSSESTIRGPREGFIESIIMNIALIRKNIKTNDLKFKFKELGTRTKTKICLVYLDGVCNPKILKEVEIRIGRINVDSISLTGHIDELIKDNPLSPFHTIGSSERPDVICSKLLEGRIALICDGTPFVLYMPYLFLENFQSSEDYYYHFIYGSINRLLRILSFLIATSMPGIYIALTTFHQEMLPTKLLLSIYQYRSGVPFPTVIECFIMLLIFDIIREGASRLPKNIAQTLGIVGALVLGDAIVKAKIVSAPIVIITALTGIATFLLPKLYGALIITRTVFILLSSILGLYGYIFGIMALLLMLVSMRSFGVPFMQNITSLKLQEIKDTAIRAPWWYMTTRPKFISSDLIRSINSNKRKR